MVCKKTYYTFVKQNTLTMKVTINTTERQNRAVDWDAPMVVTDGKQIIQTTGIHAGAYFEGIRQSDGLYSNSWYKADYPLHDTRNDNL